jgi:glycosyltransferase involved in cell wall biosynthesis
MAAGIPIVASAVGGIPEQVRHLREGLLVPPADAQALGKAMICLLQNPAQLRLLGEAGRLRVAAHFQFGTMIEQTEAVYRTVLSASPHIWEAGQASLSQMLPR